MTVRESSKGGYAVLPVETRAEVCECGCDAELHDVSGIEEAYCSNCGVTCDLTNEVE